MEQGIVELGNISRWLDLMNWGNALFIPCYGSATCFVSIYCFEKLVPTCGTQEDEVVMGKNFPTISYSTNHESSTKRFLLLQQVYSEVIVRRDTQQKYVIR